MKGRKMFMACSLLYSEHCFDDTKLHFSVIHFSVIHFFVIAFVQASLTLSLCFNHHLDKTKANSNYVLQLVFSLVLALFLTSCLSVQSTRFRRPTRRTGCSAPPPRSSHPTRTRAAAAVLSKTPMRATTSWCWRADSERDIVTRSPA